MQQQAATILYCKEGVFKSVDQDLSLKMQAIELQCALSKSLIGLYSTLLFGIKKINKCTYQYQSYKPLKYPDCHIDNSVLHIEILFPNLHSSIHLQYYPLSEKKKKRILYKIDLEKYCARQQVLLIYGDYISSLVCVYI